MSAVTISFFIMEVIWLVLFLGFRLLEHLCDKHFDLCGFEQIFWNFGLFISMIVALSFLLTLGGY